MTLSFNARIAYAAFALSLSLSACGEKEAINTTTSPANTYALTLNYNGASGPLAVTIADSASTKNIYTLKSGAIISGLKGVYTVTMPEVSGKTTPAAKTVDLSSGNQTVTIDY